MAETFRHYFVGVSIFGAKAEHAKKDRHKNCSETALARRVKQNNNELKTFPRVSTVPFLRCRETRRRFVFKPASAKLRSKTKPPTVWCATTT